MHLEEICSQLGTPSYATDDVYLFHGDALSLLSKIPNDSIQLTVTSPPYNIGKEYESILSHDDYIDWTSTWVRAAYRVTSANGALWLNLGYMPIEGTAKAMPIPYLIWREVPFFLIQEIVWNYGAGVAGRRFFSPRNEKFLWYVKDMNDYIFNLDAVRDPNVKYPFQKKNGKLKCNVRGKNPSDVWQFAKVTSGNRRSSKERTPHPAQFPVDLITRIVLASSNEGDVVFDPFFGSGSTGEAAIRQGRRVIGIEIKGDYVDIAVKRMIDVKNDMSANSRQIDLVNSISTVQSH